VSELKLRHREPIRLRISPSRLDRDTTARDQKHRSTRQLRKPCAQCLCVATLEHRTKSSSGTPNQHPQMLSLCGTTRARVKRTDLVQSLEIASCLLRRSVLMPLCMQNPWHSGFATFWQSLEECSVALSVALRRGIIGEETALGAFRHMVSNTRWHEVIQELSSVVSFEKHI
jgi:hypothetical protein